MENFERLLGKDNPMLESIKSRGFQIPTEIQEKSIPEILKRKDVIAGASTGSGKTLAFAAGLINNVKKDFGMRYYTFSNLIALSLRLNFLILDILRPHHP